MKWAGYVVCMGKNRIVYKVLVGKPERKRPLTGLGHRWEDNVTRSSGKNKSPTSLSLHIEH
jgi:hypothetical protein